MSYEEFKATMASIQNHNPVILEERYAKICPEKRAVQVIKTFNIGFLSNGNKEALQEAEN